MIYNILFDWCGGQQQVHCIFHDDKNKSAGISPSGQYNCFACGVKCSDENSFYWKYFKTSPENLRINFTYILNKQIHNIPMYETHKNYLKSLHFRDDIIRKYFITSTEGKLLYKHYLNGRIIGYTHFNKRGIAGYNASKGKYAYQSGTIAGLLTPFDDIIKYNTIIITEGEKDMLILKSLGIDNVVAKTGGASTYMIGGYNLENKNVVLVYDCDKYGRQNALRDADILVHHGNVVKVVELGLNNGEDVYDYLITYKHTIQEFKNLIKNTPEFIPQPTDVRTKIMKLVQSLNEKEKELLKEELLNGKLK